MEEQERQFALQTITQRLVIFTGSVLLLIALGLYVGKLLFWSFVSGFTERFVPQIIRKTSESGAGNP